MIFDFLSQEIAVPLLVQKGGLETSFIYNILNFLSPIYEYIVYTVYGVNQAALIIGVAVFISAYYRGHGNSFQEFSTIKRNPFVLSVLTVYMLTIMLMPMKLIFVNIKDGDDKTLQVFTEMSMVSGSYVHEARSIDNLPAVMAFPIAIFSKYVYGVSYYKYPKEVVKSISNDKDPQTKYNRFIPQEYSRFMMGGDMTPDAKPEEVGFHLGVLFDGDLDTNYRLINVVDYLNVIRAGMDQIFIDGDALTLDSLDSKLLDRAILSTIKTELNFYKNLYELKVANNSPLNKYINEHPLYKDFLKKEKIQEFKNEIHTFSNIAASRDSEIYGVPNAAYIVGGYKNEDLSNILRSCRVTAPNLLTYSDSGLQLAIDEKIEGLNLSGSNRAQSKGIITKAVNEVCNELIMENPTTCADIEPPKRVRANNILLENKYSFEGEGLNNINKVPKTCGDAWKLIDQGYKLVKKSWWDKKVSIKGTPFEDKCHPFEDVERKADVEKKYSVGWSRIPQSAAQVSLMKKSLFGVCISNGATGVDIENSWDTKLSDFIRENIKKINTLQKSVVKYENNAKQKLVNGEITEIISERKISRFGEADDDGNYNVSIRLRSLSNIFSMHKANKDKDEESKSIFYDGIVVDYKNNSSIDALKMISASAISEVNRKIDNLIGHQKKYMEKSRHRLMESMAKEVILTNLEPDKMSIKRFLSVLAFKGSVKTEDTNTSSIKLNSDYPVCEDGLNLKSKPLAPRPLKDMGTDSSLSTDELISNYYDAIYNLMIGGDKSSLKDIFSSNIRPSEDVMRSIFYSGKIAQLIHKLDGVDGKKTFTNIKKKIEDALNRKAEESKKSINVCDIFPETKITTTEIDGILNYLKGDKYYAVEEISDRRAYSAINILEYLQGRIGGDINSSKQDDLLGAINKSDITIIPYFSDIWYNGKSKKISRFHLEMKDYNVIRPATLLLVGDQLDAVALMMSSISESDHNNFKEVFLNGRYDEFKEKYIMNRGFFEDGGNFIGDFISGDWSFTGTISSALVGLVRTIGLAISEFIHLPEINKFINDMVINFISMLTASNLSFSDSKYEHPQIQEIEHRSTLDKNIARYSSYLATVASPLVDSTFDVVDDYTKSSYFLTSLSPGMRIPTTSLVTFSENSAFLNRAYEEVVDKRHTPPKEMKDIFRNSITMDVYRASMYDMALQQYHVISANRYKEFLLDPKAASQVDSGAMWNAVVAVGVVATTAFPVTGILRTAWTASRASAGTTLAAGAGVAGKSFVSNIGRVAYSRFIGGSAFKATKKVIKNIAKFVNGYPKIASIIIALALLPVLFNMAIILWLLISVAKSLRYLLMTKILPLIYFFGSIIKTFASAFFVKVPKATGRINTTFGNTVEGPVSEAFIPLFRYAMELSIYYFLFRAILVYVLNNHYGTVAIDMYEGGYYELFEAGISISIIIALWIVKYIYDLVDKLYPMEYGKQFHGDMEKLKY